MDIKSIADHVITALVGAAAVHFFGRKKENVDIRESITKSQVLLNSQQLEKDKFTLEQLNQLEADYKEGQRENKELRAMVKELSKKLDDKDRKYSDALTTITFLKLELKAKKN